MKTLLVGYGSSTRSDDGVGIVVAGKVAEKQLSDVTVRTAQQLNLEIIEEFLDYEMVILTDARSGWEPVSLEHLDENRKAGIPSSHHLDPLLMAELARHLYGRAMLIFVCSVRGENFNFGAALSDSVKLRVEEAANRIADLITRKHYYA